VTRAETLDFTSASYLGLRHPQGALGPWHRLTTGAPAALAEPRLARAVARSLAGLVGTQDAVLASSTLYGFWDLFMVLGADQLICYVDAGTYPIAGWGVERAVAHGTLTARFPHRDVTALHRLLGSPRRAGRVPVVVTDGLCPGCGLAAPLRQYLRALGPLGGLLVVDDTQALGILGREASSYPPYGRGGGGTLRMARLSSPDVLVVSSLAKGFGVPVAVIGGPRSLVRQYELRSETRVHCSPPSFAHLRAAEHALDVNRQHGDQRRARLAALVRRLRAGVRDLGLKIGPTGFPVQTLEPVAGVPPAIVHDRLIAMGVRAVLHRPACQPAARCSFLITAEHTPEQIDRAIGALGRAVTEPAVATGTDRWAPAGFVAS
jgi:8-amino-7-oxononanoate synthase